MPPKFFLTHTWKDIAFARRLCDDLTAQGLGGFFDAYSIRPGDIISAEINRGLEACDVYVPVLSHAALKSPHCEEEIYAAITLGKLPGRNGRPRIVPVLIEDCVDGMPILLRSRLYIEFANRYDEAFKELLTKAFGISTTPWHPDYITSSSHMQNETGSPGKREPMRKEVILPVKRESEPTDASGYLSRGSIYRMKGDLEQALADYTKAIEINPSFAHAYFNRGLVYRDKKMAALAIADFETFIRLEPNTTYAIHAKNYIKKLSRQF